MNSEFDGTISQWLLADAMAVLAGFEFGLLHGISLQELIEVLALAPFSFVVVEGDGASSCVTNNRIAPAGELHGMTGRLRREQFELAMYRFRVAQPLASGDDRNGIAQLGLDRHIMLATT